MPVSFSFLKQLLSQKKGGGARHEEESGILCAWAQNFFRAMIELHSKIEIHLSLLKVRLGQYMLGD